METIEEIKNDLTNKFSSLNKDFLTEKELDRSLKFLLDLENKSNSLDRFPMYVEHPDLKIKRCSNEINGFKSYISSLEIKIKERENIPNWYKNNKLN